MPMTREAVERLRAMAEPGQGRDPRLHDIVNLCKTVTEARALIGRLALELKLHIFVGWHGGQWKGGTAQDDLLAEAAKWEEV